MGLTEQIEWNTKDNNTLFKVIESLRYHEELWKCFTFLSHLDISARKYEIDLQIISIKLELSPDWVNRNVPPSLIEKFYFLVHSPNTLPEIGDKHEKVQYELESNKRHHFYYNQIKTELLGEGYDTNCYEYDLDYKFANFNMRSNCIANCIQNSIRDHLNFTDIPLTQNLLRADLLKQAWLIDKNFHNPKQVDFNQWLIEEKAKSKCDVLCQPDCTFRYFTMFNLKQEITDWEFSETIKIKIEHNSLPDLVIKYLPQTTFLSLVCNFGGLLGMWLGLSFLTILEDCISKANDFFRLNRACLCPPSINNYFSVNLNLFQKTNKNINRSRQIE